MFRLHFLATFFATLMALMILTGCLGPSFDQVTGGSCSVESKFSVLTSPSTACDSLPVDQKGSLMARVKGFPLQIKIDGEFSTSETDSILKSVEVWNAFGLTQFGVQLFKTAKVSVSENLRTLNPHACAEELGCNQEILVVKEKSISHWETLGFNRFNPGSTIRCDNGDHVVRQVIYIYPELSKESQISMIALHEIGHATGLDHSCVDGDGRPDFIGCSKVTESSNPYRKAVMYPWLPSESTALSLKENDKLRAQCFIK